MHLHLFTLKRLSAAAVVAGAAALIPAAAVATSAPSAAAAPRDIQTPCQTSGLDIWAAANRGSSYAGGYYDTIYLTNMSGHTCVLLGYAGVTAVGLSGNQIGSPAGWERGTAATLVTLAQDQTAAILVQVGDPANYGPTCFQPGTGHPGRVPLAAGLRVYPPNTSAAKVAPLPVLACYHTGPVWMHTDPAQGPVIPPYQG